MVMYDKPVWIRLYNLSIEYWSEACLEMIGRSLGMLLEIDEEIVEGDLYTYARLRIAAIREIPPSVMLLTVDGNWKQHIEIEEEIEETLLLEGPKTSKCKENQDARSDAPIKNTSLDGNQIPNIDTAVYPIDEPIVEKDLQISESNTAEQGSDDDDLNIVDPRHISQSVNIILRGAKATRGRKSHKTVREQRANEKGIVRMMKFFNPDKGGKASLGGR
ncbi:hypothetical protein SUGI_1028830 [Cryptomeria japonica]|nr:hypothetical protein SUGI_1028830 [Cryptomeria japonica]